jgi:hypothetical protein
MSLIIDCIWSEHRKDYVRYLKTVESSYDIIIDYHAISNKLSKSCPYGEEPNQSVIGLHIFKTLESALIFHTDQKILYLFKNLESVTASNLKETVTDFYYRDFKFNLNIINCKKDIGSNILLLFDEINYISV